MGNPSFFTEYLADAQQASGQIGWLVSVILAQWADETFYGGSTAFVNGNNFAGVSVGGGVNSFPSKAAGLDAYIETANLSFYDKVRAAASSGANAQAVALGQSPWAGAKYDAKDYNAGLPLSNPGIDLVNIIASYNLTQYDSGLAAGIGAGVTAGATGAGSGGPPSTSNTGVAKATNTAGTFRQTFQPIPQPAPGLESSITLDSFTIDGTAVSLIVTGAVVTPQLDLSMAKASTITLTIQDPDRVIINSQVFQETSLLFFNGTTATYPFQLVSLEKQDSVLTVIFEAWAVSALRSATGAFVVGPGTMTRIQFAQMLVQQIDGVAFSFPLNSYLRGLKEGYTGQNQEQLSRGTSDVPLEDSWTCLQRLASEIQWVCFESFKTIYFGPYSYLTSQAPVLVPLEHTDGIDTIDGTYDVGQPLGDLTVTAVADAWTPLIGDCVKITQLGPFNGNWIVSEMEREDMLEPDISITLTQPLPGLPEPSSGGATPAPAGVKKTVTAQTASGSSLADKALQYAIAQLGKPYSENTALRLGPNDFDCSGLVYMAYQSVGVSLGSGTTTFTMWPSGAGAPVPAGINNLMPGDLVFFGYGVGQAAQHVAMVVSTNPGTGTVQIIEAPHTGAFVQYSTMTPTIGAAYGSSLVYLGALRPTQ